MTLKFKINEDKAIEALAYIAGQCPQITEFYVAKILFYAEKDHLNKYGRPIIADTFIAMPYGPVPSTVRDYISGSFSFSGKPEKIDKTIKVSKGRYRKISANREADKRVFSKSDLECLDLAIAKYSRMTFDELSDLTHLERSYQDAQTNGPMDYELMIDEDNPHRKQILIQAREYAAFGVL